ncbi:MAG: glycosyltransferase [Ilumatobacter sp.]|uniref:glycosyltransferase family 2 protein n=1 Tax=Ilumatobacter sp. TaxID=1967498 RepID=UPI0032999A6E
MQNRPPPLVSVIVPTFNREDGIRRTLDGLSRQQLRNGSFETIVVSDGSTDGTNEYLTSESTPLPIVAIVQENSGPAAARNRGIEAARGELVVFLDDDVLPAVGLLQAHVDAHERADGRLVTIGPMLNPTDVELGRLVAWEQRMLYKQYDAMTSGELETSSRQFYTGNAAIARQHLVELGGFDESLRRAEDVELAYRLDDHGLNFEFLTEAISYHYASRSYRSWRANAYLYGRNDVLFGRDRDQDWMLPLIGHQFRSRHRLVRILTPIIVPRPALHRPFEKLGRGVSSFAGRLGLERVEQAILSVVYNLAYYEGVCDEVGGAAELAALLDERSDWVT